MPIAWLIFFQIIILNLSHAQATLNATQNDNDAYIDVSWSLNKDDCLTNGGTPYFDGVFIQLLADGQEIYTEAVTEVNGIANPYLGSFRHAVGPSQSVNYSITVFEQGPGIPLCNATATGSTTAFQPPQIISISNAESPDSIFIKWRNKSKLSDNFLLFRDGELIANLVGTTIINEELEYRDGFSFSSPNSIENGATYNYCIGTFSALTSNLQQVCSNGSTVDIGFTATDNQFPNAVFMQWNDLSNYGDRIQILRNGVVIKTLSIDMVNYRDESPIYGLSSIYSLVLVRNDITVVQVNDGGSVVKNGRIAGKVVTEEDLFPVKDVMITIAAIAGDTLVSDTTYTDFAGCFDFSPIFYDRTAAFTITAIKENQFFDENPQIDTLNSANPVTDDIIFLQSEPFDAEETAIEISNFTATGADGQDLINLTWDYDQIADDTMLFNIYRESSLIARLNDADGKVTTFTDLNGVPGTNYNYRLVMYRINEQSGSVAQTTAFAEAIYPLVTPPTNFLVNVQNALGTVVLNWGPTHTSSNYAGFRIYRNDEQIAELPAGTFTFTDLYGEPGQPQTYTITAFRTVNDIVFESILRPDVPAPVTFPILAIPTNFDVQSVVNGVNIRWNVPAGLTNTYNFGGFYVYRIHVGTMNTERIGEVGRGAIPASGQTISTFFDYDGIPNEAYEYFVTSYIQTPNALYESSTTNEAINFPIVTAPTGLMASYSNGQIDLDWDNYSTTFRNIEGLILYRDNDSLAVVPAGATSFTDYITNSTANDLDVTYQLRAYRILDGIRYLSLPVEANTTVTAENDNFPLTPMNVTASDDIPNHIKICWDYPVFAFSQFIVRRNGTILETLPTDARAYYDYNAPKSDAVEYSVQATFNGDDSPQAYAVGRLKYFRTLSGRVLKDGSGRGVGNVTISVTATINGDAYSVETRTDSAGYYQINDLPCFDGNVSITASYYDSDFTADAAIVNTTNVSLAITTTQDDYVQNFTDYYQIPYVVDEITQLQSVTSTSNPAKMGVVIAWSPTNPNYTGFEIYRGTALIGEVLKGEEFVYLDQGGTPGIAYGYAVRAFWDQDNRRLLSNPERAAALFPQLPAPTNFTATIIPDENRVLLQWSHFYNAHDEYVIKRNDEHLATVLTTATMLEFYDETGEPGRVYNYTIQAVKGTFVSNEAETQVIYPDPEYPRNFSATPVPSSNHVLLQWTYPNNIANGYELFRNNVSIAVLPENIKFHRDTFGRPGILDEYRIEALLDRNNERYNSRSDIATTTTFPLLLAPTELSLSLNTTTNIVELRFKYLHRGAQSFEIYRDNNLIATVRTDQFGNTPILYEDPTAVPGQTYDYGVRASTRRSGGTYYSTTTTNTLSSASPTVPTPTNFQASDGTFPNHIELTWQINSNDKIDEFEIRRGSSTGTIIATIDGGQRSYSVIETSGTYYIQGFVTVQGQRYSSGFASNGGYIGLRDQNLVDATGGNSRFGGIIATNKEWLLAGEAAGGTLKIYKMSAKGYQLHSQKFMPADIRSIDINDDGTRFIVGYNYTNNNGGARWYHLENNQWNFKSSYFRQAVNDAGRAVTIDGDRSIVTSDDWMFVFTWDGSTWTGGTGVGGVTWEGQYANGSDFVSNSIDLDGNLFIRCDFDRRDSRNERRMFAYHVESNHSLSQRENFFWRYDEYTKDFKAFDVEIEGDLIILGSESPHDATNRNDTEDVNKVKVFKWNSTDKQIDGDNHDGQYKITGGGNRFGRKVSMNGSYAAVTEVDVGVHIYSISENSASYIKTIADPGGTTDFGVDVDIHGNFVNVGAMLSNQLFQYKIFDYLNTVTATDDRTTNVEVTWTIPSNTPQSLIQGFNIYRGDNPTPISSVGAGVRNYTDSGGIPGQTYVYRVGAVDKATGQEIECKADKGVKAADGVISGKVQTQRGGIAISGVTITAVSKNPIDGGNYSYSATTNGNGEFIISNVFIGSSTADYIVTARKAGRSFTPGFIEVNLSDTRRASSQLLFSETSDYGIEGVVSLDNTTCMLEGLEITVTSYLTNGTPNNNKLTQTTKTDSKGRYSLPVDPLRTDIDSVVVSISNFKIIDPDQPMPDTLYYNFFSSDQVKFNRTQLDNLDFITEINFTDITNYPVNLTLIDACGNNIANGSRWTVRIQDRESCYFETFTTDTNGDLSVNLPPLDYKIRVTDVDNRTADNLLILNYLKSRITNLDVETIHQDSLYEYNRDPARTAPATRIAELMDKEIVYHKAPTITTIEGFNRFFCDDPGKAAILNQGAIQSLRFQITENHNNSNCPVNEGYLRINNAASTEEEPTIIHYSAELNGFARYEFTVGDPNLVDPHLYAISIEYFSPNDDFLGSLLLPVFVEGSAAIPGSDIIVNPSQGDQVQLPLFVLRDPPGDGSSSSIAEGSTISKSISANQSESGGVNAFIKTATRFFGVGGSFRLDITNGGGGAQSEGWQYSMTTTSKISTSSSQTKNGRASDVVVGAGLAMQYGLIQQLTAGDCDTIFQTTLQGFSPHSVNTTWLYTVQQIENIIKEYRNDSLRVQNGTLQYEDGGVQLSKQDAIDRLATYINNWEQVLRYHDIETLPHYTLCTREENYSSLSEEYRAAVYQWQDQFCTQIGAYEGDEFIMNDPSTIVWDNQLVDLYNQAGAAIRNLSDSIPDPNTLLLWSYNENRSDYADAEFDALFGAAAENFTYGGATSIEKSYKAARTSTKQFSNSYNFSTNIAQSLDFKDEVTFVVAPFGLGKLVKVVDFDIQAGASAKFNYNISESRSLATSENVSISYKLADGDIGDQFSTTVIQGPSPNHTPYFSLLGGRSSCPPEVGTIFRDNSNIQLIDPETGAGIEEQSRYNVPADEATSFIVKLTNLNPFNETRNLVAFLDNASNTGGAVVKLGGNFLGSQEFYGVDAGGENAVVLPLTVERGVFQYNHSIRIGLRSLCVDGTFKDETHYITVNVSFQNPCTPISLTTPSDNWVLNNANSELVIGIRDYQPDNPPLQDVRVQYRRLGAGDDWADIPLRHMKGLDVPVTPNDLQEFNDGLAQGQIPEYFFTWQLPNDDFITYPDGQYQIRVLADCGASVTTSNVLNGRISRSGLRLFGSPEPSDGLWTEGDEISFSFNRNLECTLLDDPQFLADSIKVVNTVTGLDVPFDVVCRNNKLIFLIDPMSAHDGERLEICLNGIRDAFGNTLAEPVSWAFDVITQKLYWSQDTVKVELYAGEELKVRVRLENTTLNQTVDDVRLQIKDGVATAGWLSFTPTGNFDVNPSGRDVILTITGDELTTYSDIIQVNNLTGRLPELYVEATIRAKAPYWEVENPTSFANNMNVLANWRFTGSQLASTDSLDRIAVFVDGEIRGVANIELAGVDLYVAYLTVLGNPVDEGKELEFRVWDADDGLMYQAFPEEELQFAAESIIGSVANPELLKVNRFRDLIRIIPLNQGWTWFSTNTRPPAGGINEFLKSLKNPAEGDIIKTDDAVAQYSTETGWFNPGTNTLGQINTNKGYQIYLQNQPDTLYVTGAAAIVENITLAEGWNWIGYPLADVLPVNNTLSLSPVTHGDVIKTLRQSTPTTSTIAIYNENNQTWEGSLNQLYPYDAYKVKVGNGSGSILTLDNTTPLQSNSIAKNGAPIADPEDHTTWNISDYRYEYVMFIAGEVESNGQMSNDTNDKLAAFVGNDLRGVGNMTYIPSLDRYEVGLFIGSHSKLANIDFYFYDASIDKVLNITESLGFKEEGYGTYPNPYPFKVALFNVDIDKVNTGCADNATGTIDVSVNGGQPPYFYNWSDDAQGSYRENLAAGTYTVSITDTRNIPLIFEVEIIGTDSNLPPPMVSSSDNDNKVCQGSSITLMATDPNAGATFYWEDENEQIFSEDSEVVLTNLQSDRVIKVLSEVNGCFTSPASINITVEAYIPAEFTVSDRTPLPGEQEIIFTPNVQQAGIQYTWNFGDGTSSTDMIARHTYETAGKYNVVLTTRNGNSCSNTYFRNNYIITDGSQTICESPLDSDGDGVQDDCDNCPYYSNFSQLDDNDNGKGNPCDCNFNATDIQTINIGGTLENKRYVASQNIFSNGTGESGYTEFYAGNSITLQAGFTIEKGATFLATISEEDLGNCQPLIEEEIDFRQTTTEEALNTPSVGALLVYPNPFKGNTQIVYQLEKAGEVELGLYDINGARVKTLQPQQWQNSGRISIELTSGQLPQGIYYVRLRTGQEILTQKVMLLE